ncbi:hypothetical protein [Kribbella sancticallisti]|uniref:hypothetical protein n=1 Tax=Kribbella sancticallisti TaxID=460087 RepID=UPI0031D5554C
MSFSSSTRPSAPGARGSGKAPVGGSNRLPASRERRPALAALAVILILLGAAGSALITVRSGERQTYVAIGEKALPPGTKLDRKDLARGDLAGTTGPLILWSELEKYSGHYTTGWLYPGQYLTKGSLSDKPAIPDGGALVGLSLEAGRAPSEPISAGDIVQVVRVPAANQEAAVPQVLVTAAEVTNVAGAITDARTKANTTLNVTVLVPASKLTSVAAAAASKTLVIAKLPPATRPDLARGNGGG